MTVHRCMRTFPPAGVIPYVGTLFDAGSGFNMNHVGVLTADPGQDPTTLSTPTANDVLLPRLSPDGEWILYKQAGQLRAIRVDGTGETIVWASSGGVAQPNWSADGSKILFCFLPNVLDGRETKIFTVPFDGTDQSGNEIAIYTEPSAREIPRAFYNHDGTRIAFEVMLAGGNTGIWTMDADGSGAAQIATTPGSGFHDSLVRFIWAKSHSWIAWNDGTTASPVWKRMDDDGTNVTTLITFATGYRPPSFGSWANDDSVLYYARDTLRELWSVTADGATHALVYDNGTVAFREPAWAYPGISRLYLVENTVSGNNNIVSILPDGSDHRFETASPPGTYKLL